MTAAPAWNALAGGAATTLASIVIATGLLQTVFYLAQLLFAAVSLAKRPRAARSSMLWRRYADQAPPIAVLAPAYNEEVTIVESVNSLLALHYPGFEVVSTLR